MPPFVLACLIYLCVALPSSVLGLLWPSMRLSLHEPVGALGILLAFGVAASAVSSVAAGRLLSRRSGPGPVLATGTLLTALALVAESAAPSLWVFAGGVAVFGLGFGALDSGLNVYAAGHFGARQINWMHASYGLGSTVGPLLVTALMAQGFGWRWTYGAMAAGQAVLGMALILTGGSWDPDTTGARDRGHDRKTPARSGSAQPPARARRSSAATALAASAFAAVETGIESAAGIWGYIFLTAGRGVGHGVAGVAVAGYWAMMFAGRAVLGPLAERLGAARILSGAVAGVALGATLMVVPGSAPLSVAGLLVAGLAAAPVFPLLTLTTADRMDAHGAVLTQTVGVQVAASAAGSAALPAAIGLLIGAFRVGAFAPSLLVLAVAMAALYRWFG